MFEACGAVICWLHQLLSIQKLARLVLADETRRALPSLSDAAFIVWLEGELVSTFLNLANKMLLPAAAHPQMAGGAFSVGHSCSSWLW